MANLGAVVITGASTGIGEACAFHLDRLGFKVFAGVRKVSDGEALQRRASERLRAVSLDVTDSGGIARATEVVSQAVGQAGLAGLINNAGIVVAGMTEFLPLSQLRAQLEVNVIGVVAVTQAFLPLLRKSPGRIVNIGSSSGPVATPFLGAYAASKFALEGLTDALRQELCPWAIQVSIVEPGNIRTPIWEKSLAAASQLLDQLPKEAHELYGQAIAAVRDAALREARAATPALAVAKAVTHALTAKKPKTRYTVGTDAKIQALLARFIPDRIRDGLIARHLGL
jgi:NAD(P)-dependent dehydrogenase (short-subunit alcohol dehydrogenase family)